MFDWHLFNYTDFNKINLDWIMDCLKALWGGSTNQILSKKSDNDFDFEWVNKPEVTPGTGLTEEIKQALLQLAQKVAYIDNQGQAYYQDLYDALYNEAPPVTLVSIDAVYTQSGTVYDTDTLNSLKADLVVTATYSDSTTAIIPAADYTLTGALTVGSSVITVSYGGKTDTFTVAVTENPAPPVTLVSIDAVYTQSGTVYDTDTLNSLKTDLVVTATYSDSTTAVIPANDYTLSGTLTVGSSVITVSYGGKTDTFTVNVTPHNLLYHVADREFDGTAGDGIATGVNIQESNSAFTILVILTLSNAMSGTGTKFMVFSSRASTPSIQFTEYSQNATHCNFRYMAQYSDNAFNMQNAGTYKIAVVHTAGTNSATCYMKANNGNVLTKTVNSSPFTTDPDAEFYFGSRNDQYWYLNGTLTLGEIYNRAFSSAEIDAFMSGD